MVKNIILVIADALRAKNLDIYGYDKPTTPFLSRMAKKNIYLKDFYANSPWTIPAHATIFSGKLPSEHNTTSENSYFRGENRLLTYLDKKAFLTTGISENALISSESGFGRSFDYFRTYKISELGGEIWQEIWKNHSKFQSKSAKYFYFFKQLFKKLGFRLPISLFKHLKNKLTSNSEDFNPTNSNSTIEQVFDIMSSNEDNFVFLNLMVTHARYTFNEAQRTNFLAGISKEKIERITGFDTLKEYLDSGGISKKEFKIREEAYNASINYLDTLLEEMYNRSDEETIFILTSDHGELIGEHEKQGISLVDHHFGTFKEIVEVPCIIYSKKDLELDINQGEIFDQRDILDIIKGIVEGRKVIGRDITFSEYYGKIGFNKQFNRDTPQEYYILYSRKSFSIMDSKFKYDVTSDGDYLLKNNEEIRLEETPKEFVNYIKKYSREIID